MLVERLFSEAKYKILLASDGREALKLFSEHEPSMVITDWTMPDISGIELCRRIRSDFQHLYPYVILLTGNSNKEEIIEGLAAGADDYLTGAGAPDDFRTIAVPKLLGHNCGGLAYLTLSSRLRLKSLGRVGADLQFQTSRIPPRCNLPQTFAYCRNVRKSAGELWTVTQLTDIRPT